MRVVLTWATLFGLYLLLTGQASLDETIAAALVATIGAALSVAVRVGSGQAFSLPPRAWLYPTAKAVGAVPKEIAMVTWQLMRRHPGTGILEGETVQSTGQDAESERAVQVLAASFAPNRYVVGLTQGNKLLMHRFARRR